MTVVTVVVAHGDDYGDGFDAHVLVVIAAANRATVKVVTGSRRRLGLQLCILMLGCCINSFLACAGLQVWSGGQYFAVLRMGDTLSVWRFWLVWGPKCIGIGCVKTSGFVFSNLSESWKGLLGGGVQGLEAC